MSSTSSDLQQVTLAVYDLSAGMAAQLSQALIGQRVEGIWHTGIRAFGREFYYGQGIYNDTAGATPFGVPTRVDALGTTTKSRGDFDNFLRSVEISSRFGPTAYHLLDNNCNHFTDACAKFLVNAGIDPQIVNLPQVVKQSPLLSMFTPAIDAMQQAQQSGGQRFQPTAAQHPHVQPPLPNISPPSNDTASPNGNILAQELRGNFGRYRRQLGANPVILGGGNKDLIEQRIRQSVSQEGSFTIDQLVSIACSEEHSDVAFAALDLLRYRAALRASPSPNGSTSSEDVPSSAQLKSLIQRHILGPYEASDNDGNENPKHDERATLLCIRLCVNTIKYIDADLLSDVLEYTTEARIWRTFRAGVLLLRNFACTRKEHGEDRRIRILYFAHECLHRMKHLPHESIFGADVPEKEITLLTTPLLQSLAATVDCDNNDNAAEWDILSAYGFRVAEYEKRADLKKDEEAKKAIDMLARLRTSLPDHILYPSN